MTARTRACVVVALLVVLAVVIPTTAAYLIGRDDGRREVRRLEQRVERLEGDVGDLLE